MREPKSVAVSLTQVIHEEGRPDGNQIASQTILSLSLFLSLDMERFEKARTGHVKSLHVLCIDLACLVPT